MEVKVEETSQSPLSVEVNNHNYVQGLLDKSVNLSKKVYEKTGLKNEFIEQNAQKINKSSSQLASILDTQIDGALSKVSATTKTLTAKTTKGRQQLIQRAKNLALVKHADNLSNVVLSQLEQQVELLSRSICGKLSIAAPDQESNLEESEEKPSKKTLATRASQLVTTLNYLGQKIAETYLQQLFSNSVVKSAQEKYTLVDAKAKNVRASLESFTEVLIGTVIQQNIITPLLKQLSVRYIQSKESVVVVISNIRSQDVNSLLALAKDSYTSLRQASLAVVSKEKLSLTFAQTFFNNSFSTIQSEIAQLLTDLSALKARFVENGLALYRQCLKEFKHKKAVKLGQHKAIAESTEGQEANLSANNNNNNFTDSSSENKESE